MKFMCRLIDNWTRSVWKRYFCNISDMTYGLRLTWRNKIGFFCLTEISILNSFPVEGIMFYCTFISNLYTDIAWGAKNLKFMVFTPFARLAWKSHGCQIGAVGVRGRLGIYRSVFLAHLSTKRSKWTIVISQCPLCFIRCAASTIALKAYASYTPVPTDSKLGRKHRGGL